MSGMSCCHKCGFSMSTFEWYKGQKYCQECEKWKVRYPEWFAESVQESVDIGGKIG